MKDYNWIIISLLVLGWIVTWCIAHRMHKKTDRANLINKKNDILRALEPKALLCWEKNFNDIKKYDEIISEIQQIISVYEELINDHRDTSPPALNKLRRVITLDIESKEKFETKELSDKKREIKKVINELRFQPPKF